MKFINVMKDNMNWTIKMMNSPHIVLHDAYLKYLYKLQSCHSQNMLSIVVNLRAYINLSFTIFHI